MGIETVVLSCVNFDKADSRTRRGNKKMRLIDADALKKYILINNVGCGCSEDYQESFLSAVEDQPTIEPQTEIPCSDAVE